MFYTVSQSLPVPCSPCSMQQLCVGGDLGNERGEKWYIEHEMGRKETNGHNCWEKTAETQAAFPKINQRKITFERYQAVHVLLVSL